MTRIFKINAGGQELDFMDNDKYLVQIYKPKIARYKQGGFFADSPITDGRRLASKKFGNVAETVRISIFGTGATQEDAENDLMTNVSNLAIYLERVANYWDGLETSVPYVVTKSNSASDEQYSIFYIANLEELGDLFGSAIETGAQVDGDHKPSAWVDLTLSIERGMWLSSAPGVATCVQISAQQSWESDAQFIAESDAITDGISLLQIANGTIFAGEDGEIYESIDDGDNWSLNSSTPVGAVRAMIQLANGYIIAGDDGQILRSTNNGSSWSAVSTAPNNEIYSLLQTSSGRVLAGEEGVIPNAAGLYKSDDNGGTWALISDDFWNDIVQIIETITGKLLIADEGGRIWASEDDGDNWKIVFENRFISGSLSFRSLLQLSTGDILAFLDTHAYISEDDGATWAIISVNLFDFYNDNFGFGVFEDTDGVLWGVSAQGYAITSEDEGKTWKRLADLNVGIGFSGIQTTTGRRLLGVNDNATGNGIFIYDDPTILEMGSASTCNNTPIVGNKHGVSNLTHIFIDDGGVFGSNLLPMSAFPITLFPAVPVANDALYFISDTSIIDGGIFDNVIFDIDTPGFDDQNDATSYNLVWEYVDGAGPTWGTLTTSDRTYALSSPGVNGVFFSPPSDWVEETVNGVTGYIIRLRVSSLSGVMSPPTQQNRNIYSTVLPYVEVASNQISGSLPALTQIKAYNRSDEDGPGGSSPNFYSNRIVVGFRDVSLGSNFSPYLNISDEKQPFGVEVSLGTNTTFGDSSRTSSGRAATYNPSGSEAMAARATVTLRPGIAGDYYGKYKAFVRVQRTAGSASDIAVQLQVSFGSGGGVLTTSKKQIRTTTAFEVLDFGLVSISKDALSPSDTGDATEIKIMASSESGTPNLVIFDIILMPIEEYSGDFVDQINSSLSDIGRSSDIDKFLDIDSISYPKTSVRSLVKTNANLVTSKYKSRPEILMAINTNSQQRIWFFAMQTNATGANPVWIAPPEICHSIQLFKQERYLSPIGNV